MPPRTSRFTFFAVGLFIACGIPVGTAAASEVSQFFDDVNGGVNVTQAGAFKGQAASYYTGGSLYMRAPSQRYQLLTLTPPHFSVGCNGIDATLGGFGHISSDKLIQMGKNILANAPGAFFQMALQNMCQPCSDIMQGMRDLANVVNRSNISSCEAAKGLVTASTAMMNAKEGEATSALVDSLSGMSPDFSAATSKFQSAWSNITGKTDTSKVSNNSLSPEAKAAVKQGKTVGNLTWRAINKVGADLPTEQKMVMMSLLGTVIFPTVDTSDGSTNETPIWRGKTAIKFDDFVGSPVSTSVSVPVYRCIDNYDVADTGCMNISVTTKTIETFYPYVSNMLDQIYTKTKQRDQTGWNDTAKSFASISNSPVLKLMRAAAGMKGDAGSAFIQQYKELIAAQMARLYLEQIYEGMRSGLSDVGNEEAKKAAGTTALKELRLALKEHKEANDIHLERIERQMAVLQQSANSIAQASVMLYDKMDPTTLRSLGFSKGR